MTGCPTVPGAGLSTRDMIANLVSQSAGSLTYYPLQTPQDDWSKVYNRVARTGPKLFSTRGYPGCRFF